MTTNMLYRPPPRHDHKGRYDPHCVICSLKKPFKMPNDIVQALYDRKLVFFAGAGISTEARQVFPYSLADLIRAELHIPSADKTSFSKLMTQYCKPPRGRRALLRLIRNRFDTMKVFPEFYRLATRFHNELSTIPFVDEIITTNWDDLFETACDAIPIVTSEDFAAFSDISGRKVLKIHGSISNYGSIVATEDDYSKCYRSLKTGVIGAKLKVLLASKVIVFVGYSFDDMEFQRTYRLLTREVKGLAPRSYLVTVDEDARDKLASRGIEATPIITDAAFFVEMLKRRAVRDKRMIPDERFDGLVQAGIEVDRADSNLVQLSTRTYPSKIFCWYFHDGLRHALQYILGSARSGGFSDPSEPEKVSQLYLQLRQEAIRTKKYVDVAYIDGFLTGITFFKASNKDRRSLPFYYVYGHSPMRRFDDFKSALKRASKFHKAANEFAVHRIADIPGDLYFLHHLPLTIS